ncbi:hypothetical protein HDV01_003912 [Terramyces sp. JEL0728]|nr:hypothetical protein HDV01_003912 [Terramyces sp. JEL0728]
MQLFMDIVKFSCMLPVLLLSLPFQYIASTSRYNIVQYILIHITRQGNTLSYHFIRLIFILASCITYTKIEKCDYGYWIGDEIDLDSPETMLILYMHGGGFVAGRPTQFNSFHFKLLSELPKSRILSIDYPLAPEQRFPGQLEYISSVYRQFEHLKCKKVMIGDSAGGNLVLTSCIYMSKLGFKVPHILVGISPWVDLSNDYLDVETDVLHSEILESFQTNYCSLTDTENKLVSPLLIKENEMGCFSGKNIMLTSGAQEVLEPQIKEMADKLSKVTNVDVSFMFKYLAISASALAFVPTGLTADFTLPDNEVLFNKYFGKGTQNYKCNGTVWALDSADADLFAGKGYSGAAVITHFFLPAPGDAKGGRPTWKYNSDGSQVTGVVTKRVSAPSATDIQWLIVNRTSSTTNTGVMDTVDFVFRLYTVAGIAPAASQCSYGNAGSITKVPYEAEYWFYQPAVATTTTTTVATTTTTAVNLQPAVTVNQYQSDPAVATTAYGDSANYGGSAQATAVTTNPAEYGIVSSANKIAASLFGFFIFVLFA